MKRSMMVAAAVVAMTCAWGMGCATGELPEVEPDYGQPPVTQPDMPGGEVDMGLPVYDFGGYDLSGPRSEEMGFVLNGCDVVGQNCATRDGLPHKCVFNLQWDTVCMPVGTEQGVGQSCEGIQQCAVGAVCVSWGDERGTRCERVCPLDATGICALGQRCAESLPEKTAAGLCIQDTPRCDIVRQTCDSGDCVLRRHPDTGELGEFCGSAGATPEGQACAGHTACEAGMICVRPAEADEAQCVRVCRPPEAGQIPTCRDGKTCAGTASASGLMYCL